MAAQSCEKKTPASKLAVQLSWPVRRNESMRPTGQLGSFASTPMLGCARGSNNVLAHNGQYDLRLLLMMMMMIMNKVAGLQLSSVAVAGQKSCGEQQLLLASEGSLLR